MEERIRQGKQERGPRGIDATQAVDHRSQTGREKQELQDKGIGELYCVYSCRSPSQSNPAKLETSSLESIVCNLKASFVIHKR